MLATLKMIIMQKHMHITNDIPYKNKYWLGTKFGDLVNHHAIAKFKSCQYFFS